MKMLPQPRLRFLLADDPGAGKTIMAGLFIKEMKLREAIDRILILCPAPLTIQWQDELLRWFNEPFDIVFSAVEGRGAPKSRQEQTGKWRLRAAARGESDRLSIAPFASRPLSLQLARSSHRLVLNLENRLGRVSARSVSLHNRQWLKP